MNIDEQIFNGILSGDVITVNTNEDIIKYGLINLDETLCVGIIGKSAIFHITLKYNKEVYITNPYWARSNNPLILSQNYHNPSADVCHIFESGTIWCNVGWLKEHALEWYHASCKVRHG